MATQIEHARRLFTVEEYGRMVEAGILREDDRVELIEGEIIEMAPIGSRHTACVSTLTELLVTTVGSRARVWTQGAVRLSPRAKPQPDVALLRRRSYVSDEPGPEDVLLLVEVAESSLAYDRGVKLRLYARAGVPEVWIVDVGAGLVEVHRVPEGDAYREIQRLPPGATVAPALFPDAILRVNDIFA